MAEERFDFDLDPVTFITVGTVGPPGERTFYLQAAKTPDVVTVVIEKEHAAALSVSIGRLMEASRSRKAKESTETAGGMDLLQPLSPEFRVGQIGIGVDEDRELIVLVAEELVPEDEEGQKARFVASFSQMRALARQAVDVVNAGRPVCELCGEPIEPEGHFCPRQNGHPPATE